MLNYPKVLTVFFCFFSFAFYLPHINDGFGGFHGGTNEPFFARLGLSLIENPLSYPTRWDGSVDNNIPPLFAYLVFFSYKIFGVSEGTARLVSLISSVGLVFSTYLIGKKLFGENGGLVSAAVLSAMPMHSVLAYTAQTDMTFIFFGTTAIAFALYDKPKIAGVFLGLSILTKQVGILFLVGLFLVGEKGFLKYAALTVSPLFAYHLIWNFNSFILGQRSRIGLATSHEGSRHGLNIVFYESFWGLSPLIFLFFLIGAWKVRNNLVKYHIIIFLVFFMLYNKHGYYLAPIAPFAALSIGGFIVGVNNRRFAVGLTLLLLFSGFFYSANMMCSKKFGYNAFRDLEIVDGGQILIDDYLAGNYVDSLYYYVGADNVVHYSEVDIGGDGLINLDYSRPTYNLIHVESVDLKSLSPIHRGYLMENAVFSSKFSPVIFGYAFVQPTFNTHFFNSAPFEVKKLYPFNSFGFYEVGKEPELFLLKLRLKDRVYVKDNGVLSIVFA